MRAKDSGIILRGRREELDFGDLKDEDVPYMTAEEVTDALMLVLQNMDKLTQRKLIRTII